MIQSADQSIVSPVLTDIEAAAYLRLTDNRESEENAVRALNRLVDAKLLRPAIIGKHRRYTLPELDRFLAARVEAYGGAR